MGVDLTLLPFDCDQGDFAYSHTVLSLERWPDLYDEIAALPALAVPQRFTSYLSRDGKYSDSHHGRTVKDCYGEPVKFTHASEIVNCGTWPDTPVMRAIKAYLSALEPETKVALFWH